MYVFLLPPLNWKPTHGCVTASYVICCYLEGMPEHGLFFSFSFFKYAVCAWEKLDYRWLKVVISLLQRVMLHISIERCTAQLLFTCKERECQDLGYIL